MERQTEREADREGKTDTEERQRREIETGRRGGQIDGEEREAERRRRADRQRRGT